jgi:ankyrin repeat protein
MAQSTGSAVQSSTQMQLAAFLDLAYKGSPEALTEAKRPGFDVNAQLETGPKYTALHAASRGGNVELVKYLLGAGATVDTLTAFVSLGSCKALLFLDVLT